MTALQPTLHSIDEPTFDETMSGLVRTDLALGAWIERVPAWLTGDQTLFDDLVTTAPWEAHRRPMYDRMVDVPRLTATLEPADAPPVLRTALGFLAHRYGEPLERIALAHYRDGNDSVAPHGDQIARDLDTSVMAIVSLGAPRRFVLAPAVTGPRTVGFDLGGGDLLVMGGTIQRTWRHGVPKTRRPAGPRISVMLRPPWLG